MKKEKYYVVNIKGKRIKEFRTYEEADRYIQEYYNKEIHEKRSKNFEILDIEIEDEDKIVTLEGSFIFDDSQEMSLIDFLEKKNYVTLYVADYKWEKVNFDELISVSYVEGDITTTRYKNKRAMYRDLKKKIKGMIESGCKDDLNEELAEKILRTKLKDVAV